MASRLKTISMCATVCFGLLALALAGFSLFGGAELAVGNIVLRAQRGASIEFAGPPWPASTAVDLDQQAFEQGNDNATKSVILFIGDGMGIGHVSAAAALLAKSSAQLAMVSTQHIGLMSTWAANDLTTDSAAAATAMATGFKTDRKMVGVLPDGRSVRNIFEAARSRGLATGLVTTSGLVDATPACFAAHVAHRDNYDKILAQMLDSGTDLMLGGDWSKYRKAHRNPAYRDLAAEIEHLGEDRGYHVIRDPGEMQSAALPLLGFYPPRPDNPCDYGPPLAESTRLAIDLLAADPEGFLLLVECEATDELAHDNDIKRTMAGIRELDAAVAIALDRCRRRDDLLVLVTADHDTGTLALIDGKYDTGRAIVRWASGEHSAQWVPLFAFGAGASRFAGPLDNTEIGRRIASVLGLELPSILAE